jgi:glutathione S-transferase
MNHTLVTIPFSHFCEKARWALEAAGVPFVEEGHCPVLHRPAVARVHGRGSVPVLVVDRTRTLDDSPLIVAYADAQARPGRELWPTGKPRDEGLALERELDHDFAPHVRRFIYYHLLPRRDLTMVLFAIETPAREVGLVRLAFPLVRAVMRRFMRVHEAGMHRSRDAMARTFDEVAERLRDGRRYLLGDTFTAADITFASLAAPMVQPPEHPKVRIDTGALPAPLIDAMRAARAHPAGEFALRMYREHRFPA